MNSECAETIDRLSTRDGYDRWAMIYDDEENPLIALEEPRFDQLLGDVRGLEIADVGCGTGRHALRLARAGANVSAWDFSEAMLERARRKIGPNDQIAFQVHDLTQPLPAANQSFDRVVCGLVIDHIPNLESLFREMKRICRPGGFATVSVMHPALMLRGIQARFRDPEHGREVRPESCLHQVSDYVTAAIRADFAIDHISEHAVDEALASRVERARKYLGWPLLLLMRLVR